MNETQFNVIVNELITAVRGGNHYNGFDVSDRQVRINVIKQLTETFTNENGKRPDQTQLERLTDSILYEELSDSHPDKVTREEYPFLSEYQFEERYADEVPLKVAEERGTDGKDYRSPNRRKRSKSENRLIDLKARARNKEIAQRYREFVGPQPVITLTTMSPDEIDAYLNVKYTNYQLEFAKGHGKSTV